MRSNPSRAKTPSRPTCASPGRRMPTASGQASTAVAPASSARSIAPRIKGTTTPSPVRPGRTNRQAISHTSPSSSRGRWPRSRLRPVRAVVKRARGPHAHQPTGSPSRTAITPIGSDSDAASPSNRRRFPPPYQPVANCHDVEQKAVHQQCRVVREEVNSCCSTSRRPGPTGWISTSAMIGRVRTQAVEAAVAAGCLVPYVSCSSGDLNTGRSSSASTGVMAVGGPTPAGPTVKSINTRPSSPSWRVSPGTLTLSSADARSLTAQRSSVCGADGSSMLITAVTDLRSAEG